MKDIAIYGAGGCGREIACLINKINKEEPTWNLIGFFDDGKKIGDRNEYGFILGGMNELNAFEKPINLVFGIGSPRILFTLTSSIINKLIDFPNIISPDVIFWDKDNIVLGQGNVISAGCIISCNVEIGDFNIFNSMVIVGHDARIGSCNTFMPCTRISGQVTIGDGNFFGVSSTILQQIKIGNHTTIGANSLIIHRTKDEMTYMGSPATILHY